MEYLRRPNSRKPWLQSKLWFGFTQPADTSASEPQISTVEGHVVNHLREAPSAIVIDDFETPHKGDPDGCEEWLKTLLGIEGVWLIVTTQGYYKPGGIHWSKPIEPKLLSLEFARDLFCKITDREASHRRDPRLDGLLEDMSGVPHAIDLLARQTAHLDDLDPLFARWEAKGTPSLQRMGGPDRYTSLPVVYRLANENTLLDDGARNLLRALACLPTGASEADYPAISETVGETSPWDAADMLIQAALVYRESDRLRILSPLPGFRSSHLSGLSRRIEARLRCLPRNDNGRPRLEHFRR